MISLRRLAELSDYSVATVSMALRDDPRIKAETRRLIKKLADQHDYRRNRVAEGIFAGKMRQVALVLPELELGGLGRIARTVIDAFERRGLTTVLFLSHNDPKREIECFRMAAAYRVSGLIVLPCDCHLADAQFESLRKHDIPVVLISEQAPDVKAPHVHGDDMPGGAMIAEHLLQLGHRRIACIIGRHGRPAYANSLIGFEEALALGGVPLDPALRLDCGWGVQDAYDAMRRLMAQPHPPTAVFTVTDHLAQGAMRAVQDMGLDVPGDVSIAGFGNSDAGRWSHPRLTTVGFLQEEHVARHASQMLLDLMDLDTLERIPKALQEVSLPRRLIVRESTGEAGVDGPSLRAPAQCSQTEI